jgi:plasmid stabilization system protein ParE
LSYTVIIQSRAQAEFESQVAYLHDRSPKGAEAWALEFKITINQLEDDPLRFGLAPESDAFSEEVRQVQFRTRKGNPYRILFTVIQAKVFVLTVRGLGQDFYEQD